MAGRQRRDDKPRMSSRVHIPIWMGKAAMTPLPIIISTMLHANIKIWLV